MLKELMQETKKVGLLINTTKIKVMSNLVLGGTIDVDNHAIEEVKEYKYLGHNMVLSRDIQTTELQRRIGLGWAAYGNLKKFFASNISQYLKCKMYDQCVLPVLTYWAETLTLTKSIIKKLSVVQRKHKRAMLQIRFSDRMRNTELRRKLGILTTLELRML